MVKLEKIVGLDPKGIDIYNLLANTGVIDEQLSRSRNEITSGLDLRIVTESMNIGENSVKVKFSQEVCEAKAKQIKEEKQEYIKQGHTVKYDDPVDTDPARWAVKSSTSIDDAFRDPAAMKLSEDKGTYPRVSKKWINPLEINSPSFNLLKIP